MARRRRIAIDGHAERALLSDVLPYELPPTFSNRHFFDFVTENHIEVEGNTISWMGDDGALKPVIKLALGIGKNMVKDETDRSITLDSKKSSLLWKLPFGFRITHRDDSFRELTLIHPFSQLKVVELYRGFRHLIPYYCSRSSFSLRRPWSIAKHFYHRDSTHEKLLSFDHELSSVEEIGKEYESTKSFYVYKEFSNIYKFFESYRYHRAEKKFGNLFRFDVAKCFDSIYTHSLAWAIIDRTSVKEHIGRLGETLPGRFDRLMQELNYGETNGIVIGPEFSRIFAELILQRIDVNVERALLRDPPKLTARKDYEVYRYVDDVFVFYNDDKVRAHVYRQYQLELRHFKLGVNEAKSEILSTPLVTNITRAKLRISDLLEDRLSIRIDVSQPADEGDVAQHDYHVSANRLITRFKTTVRECEIGYEDIQNYTLACLSRKLKKILNSYARADDQAPIERKFVQAVLQIIDFAFFLYAVAPKVNTTIKICGILGSIIPFVRNLRNVGYDNRHRIFKKVYDETSLILKRNARKGYAEVETLYLLVAMKQLGRDYLLEESVLESYIGLDEENPRLNHLSLTVLMFYVEDRKRYSKTHDRICDLAIERTRYAEGAKPTRSAESIFILLDFIACPFVANEFKHRLLTAYGDDNPKNVRDKIIGFREFWFTKWTRFDFMRELAAKRAREVY